LDSINADTIDINWFSILSPVAGPEFGFGGGYKKICPVELKKFE